MASFLALPAGTSVYDVVDRSREASLEFLSGTNGAWSRMDFARWLNDSYARATAPTSSAVAHARTTLLGGPFSNAPIESVLLRTRAHVLDLLAASKMSLAVEPFAREREARFVVGVRDAFGAVGFAPVDHPEMQLVDRVSSLLIADYLTRPGEYRDICICEDCGEVSYTWRVAHHDGCAKQETTSGVVPKYATPPAGDGRKRFG